MNMKYSSHAAVTEKTFHNCHECNPILIETVRVSS